MATTEINRQAGERGHSCAAREGGRRRSGESSTHRRCSAPVGSGHRAELQITAGEEPILPPFTPNPMPADQSVIKDYSPFRPVARSPVAQPLVLELDMDYEDISDDTTEPDSNETHL